MTDSKRLDSAILTLRAIADRLEKGETKMSYEIFVMRQSADLYEGIIGTIGKRQ